ncbi:MAG: heavy metal-associated domain-containing protein [Patescibacteria group bacterium]
MSINFRITDITCEACVKLSKVALEGLPGVTKATINSEGLATVESDRELDWAEITSALAEVDKKASLI